MSYSLAAEAVDAFVGFGDHVTTRLGSFVARERTARGMTQAELARAADLSASFVAQIEQGRRTRPTKETLRKLAQGLGMSYVTLLIGSGEVDAEELGAPAPHPPELAVLISELSEMTPADWNTVRVFLRALKSRPSAMASDD